MLIVPQDRHRPVALNAVRRPPRRHPPALSRARLIICGLIALAATGVFAIVDHSSGRAARAPEAVERAPVVVARADPQPVRAEPGRVSPAVERAPVVVARADPQPVRAEPGRVSPSASQAIATPAASEPAYSTRSEVLAAPAVAPTAHATAATAAPEAAGPEGPATTGAFTVARAAARPPDAEAAHDTGARAAPKTSAAAPANCPLPALRAVLADVSARFGEVAVVATHQHKTPNHLSGSSREKLHHDCKAIDFRPDRSRIEEIKAYLRIRPEIAGVESYRDGVVHMDLAAPAVATRSARGGAAMAQTEASKTLPVAR